MIAVFGQQQEFFFFMRCVGQVGSGANLLTADLERLLDGFAHQERQVKLPGKLASRDIFDRVLAADSNDVRHASGDEGLAGPARMARADKNQLDALRAARGEQIAQQVGRHGVQAASPIFEREQVGMAVPGIVQGAAARQRDERAEVIGGGSFDAYLDGAPGLGQAIKQDRALGFKVQGVNRLALPCQRGGIENGESNRVGHGSLLGVWHGARRWSFIATSRAAHVDWAWSGGGRRHGCGSPGIYITATYSANERDLGTGSLSSCKPRTCISIALCMLRVTCSRVLPVATQPGKSGE